VVQVIVASPIALEVTEMEEREDGEAVVKEDSEESVILPEASNEDALYKYFVAGIRPEIVTVWEVT
jgi:hypothetical protein